MRWFSYMCFRSLFAVRSFRSEALTVWPGSLQRMTTYHWKVLLSLGRGRGHLEERVRALRSGVAQATTAEVLEGSGTT
jgi:hypothetical protein